MVFGSKIGLMLSAWLNFTVESVERVNPSPTIILGILTRIDFR